MKVIDLTLLDKVSSEAKESPLLPGDRYVTCKWSMQTHRPFLCPVWAVYYSIGARPYGNE